MQHSGFRGLVKRFEIAENSMEPTLFPGDYVVATAKRHIERGQIVVFEHPQRNDFLMVKRVVGLAREEIVIADGEVLINGAALAEPWTDEPTLMDGHWEIGLGEVFVLGDNRGQSHGDSRQIGPISSSGLMVVRMRYWPSMVWVR